ncbi:MAG: flagellar basal body rod protein FlgB [Gammaproteobacteria bacterium]|uniref:Flagellar basal body rod protein FlgB n=1 Tax=OM182 bacterium TaxID=2510334 RepID=A0A520S113_9GAMM|nr:flagellar basal body rod protein FlgB [Gammaproteobacteria bacterium]OUV67430.1 MAG: flagellar basal-body rod protein FlgB [Gammaproteobacteria bacterium TMED133]RZO76148.1 MAG: flagellar basal body rod protein FlgB [OM182 bacterium]
MSTFGNIFGIHEQALQLRQERMRVLSENVANAETPHYKSKDIDFRAAMSASVRDMANLNRTNQSHMESRAVSGNYEVFRNPVNTAADGNTVELHHQQMEFGKESSRYLATVQFIENRIGGIRRALKGE